MFGISHRRIGAIVLVAAVTVIVSTTPLWGSWVGRRIAWLSVERVEVTGTRLLDAGEVVAASGVALGQPLLDEPAVWESALRLHPVIADVAITRRPPHTLRIHVTEKAPVALLADGTLKLATAAGEILPVEPHVVPLDLPIVHGTFDDSARAETTRATLAETGRLTSLAPALMRAVSEIRARDGGEVLQLSHDAAEIVIPLGATALRIEELKRVLTDLEVRYPAGAGSQAAPGRHLIDLRFDGQVVVRPSRSGERS
jgi:cell division protein FtsQ